MPRELGLREPEVHFGKHMESCGIWALNLTPRMVGLLTSLPKHVLGNARV